jgi:hypothetical protein
MERIDYAENTSEIKRIKRKELAVAFSDLKVRSVAVAFVKFVINSFPVRSQNSLT